MPSILIADLFTRTSYTLQEASDRVLGDLGLRDNNICTSGDVAAWLNEGQMILTRDSQAFFATVNVATVSGTAEYLMPYDSEAKAISVEEVLYQNRPLAPMSIDELFAYNPQWRSASAGVPWAYYQRGANLIGVHPAPSASGTADLQVTCVVLPPKVSAPEDFFYCPNGCEDALIVYAKLQASLKDAAGEGEKRIPYYTQEWEKAKLRAAQVVSEARGRDFVCLGKNARLDRAPFGLRVDPWARAVPLP